MIVALQVLATMFVALAAALSVAHALEFPGKLRLDKDTYLAVQRNYYPGFSIGGAGEFRHAPTLLLVSSRVRIGSVLAPIAALVSYVGVSHYW